MLGTVIGDIIGSVYEFKNHRSKDFLPLFHPQFRFTDETVCTVAIADALVSGTDPKATLIEWCRRYAENGSWGKRFAEWFMDDNPQPYGSWGNGAAMRISPVGLLATSEDEAISWSDAATAITHNHPEGIASARAVALAIFWARHKAPAQVIGQRLTERFGYDLSTTPDDIRPAYTRTERAAGSVPQAIICVLQSTSYEDAIRNAVSIGGDSDTIAAIAGGIAEALHGISNAIAVQAWAYLPKEMQSVLARLYEEVPKSKSVRNLATSKTNSEPQPATVSMYSRNQKPAKWQATTMLSQSEIELLRQNAKQASSRMKAILQLTTVVDAKKGR